MAFFSSKKKEAEPAMAAPPAPAARSIPSEDVIRMRQQGMSNSQIVESMQRSGYRTTQILDAMNQADIGRSAEPIQGAPYFGEQQAMAQPPPQQGMSRQIMEQPDYPQAQAVSYDEKIEEIAEAIIEEKWNELVKDIQKIVEWKNSMEASMKALEQRQNDLKQTYDGLQRALMSKLTDYDQNITSVNSELKALEKVFQKLLPTFTENVNELSRTVKELKKKG